MPLSTRPSIYLQPADDGSHPAVQRLPAPVALMDRELELAGSVGPVLPGQTAVLVVDQLQVCQAFVNLPLETLKDKQAPMCCQTGFYDLRHGENDPNIQHTTSQTHSRKLARIIQADLKPLQLLLGDSIKDVSGVWVGGGALRRLQPIFKL